jgi:hypothetical protein
MQKIRCPIILQSIHKGNLNRSLHYLALPKATRSELGPKSGKKFYGNLDGLVLDIIHVVEYLWDVANTLDKGQKIDRRKWVYDRLLSILNGNVGRVIGGLKQIITKNKKRLTNAQIQELERVITYFKNHKKWMKYNGRSKLRVINMGLNCHFWTPHS